MKRIVSAFGLTALLIACFVALSPGSAAFGQDMAEEDEQEMAEEGEWMSDVAVDSGYVEVNGARIFYMEAGEGTPMVLVHGWPLGSGLFTRNIAALSEQYHVIAVDLRGFGKSSSPGDQPEARINTYAQDVLAVMDEMGIEQAVIGGMSMGGPVVFAMYQEAPDRFMGMLLMDTIAAAAAAPEKHLWLGWVERIQKKGVDAIPGYVMDEMLTAEARMEEPNELFSQLKSLMLNASKEGAIAGAKALAYRPNFRPLLSDIDVPTLILVGFHDTIYPYGISQYMHQHIPNSDLKILKTGSHASILEAAEQANEAILTWMDDMPVTADY